MVEKRAVVSIETLRERIRALEGPRVASDRVPTGFAPIDRLLGGLPVPGIVEIAGAPGSGRTRLACALAASALTGDRPTAWIDAPRLLHPPALAALGVRPEHTVVLRPTGDRESWAVEQVLRSGCFPLVVAVEPGRLGRGGQRWALAAEAGRCCLLVLVRRPERMLPAHVRLAATPGELLVARDRSGRPSRSDHLPSPPSDADPWS